MISDRRMRGINIISSNKGIYAVKMITGYGNKSTANAARDEKTKNANVWKAGGRSLIGAAGLEFSFGRTGVGMKHRTPLSQHLGEGKVRAGDRGMAYVGLSF